MSQLLPQRYWITMISFLLFCAFISGIKSTDDGDQCDKDKPSSCGCSQSRDKSQYVEQQTHEETVQTPRVKHEIHSSETVSPYTRTHGMVYIEGGHFYMGTNTPVFQADGEGPQRGVNVNSFYMDTFEVSNAEFELFVNNTSYKTEVIII